MGPLKKTKKVAPKKAVGKKAKTVVKKAGALKKKAMPLLEKLKAEVKEKAARWAKEKDVLINTFKEEFDEKARALRVKVKALEEYKKVAEGKVAELEAKGREFVSKVGTSPKERPGLVTFKGNPLTLLGPELKVGDKAPDFQVVDNAMQTKTLANFAGKIKIISSVPSLDTPVCNTETRRFNEEAARLPEKVVVLTISLDLPFAQARWCAAAGVERVKTFSDYRDRSFGLGYGVLIKELKLLSRAVFIVDEQNVIRYIELVPEVTQEPQYARILDAAQALL
jgi:thioredoxin-dependent peroxiredoxin